MPIFQRDSKVVVLFETSNYWRSLGYGFMATWLRGFLGLTSDLQFSGIDSSNSCVLNSAQPI